MTFDFSTFMKQRALRHSPALNIPVMKWISLPCNGKNNLDFMGERIATIVERNAVHSGASEWKLSIYRALPDHYVFASELKLTSPERLTLYSARTFSTIAEMRTYLLEQHGQVELPRKLLEQANMLGNTAQPKSRLSTNDAAAMLMGGTSRPTVQWGDGWASVWQRLANGGFAYAQPAAVTQ